MALTPLPMGLEGCKRLRLNSNSSVPNETPNLQTKMSSTQSNWHGQKGARKLLTAKPSMRCTDGLPLFQEL